MKKVDRLALRLAKIYRRKLKADKSVYVRPFSLHLPVEKQSVFKHFRKAAEILVEEGIEDPKAFIDAQFVGLKWANRFPFPQQLHTTGARLRYMEHANKVAARAARTVVEEDYVVNEFEVQERKLKRMCAAMALGPKAVLRLHAHAFTKAFLRSKGDR